MRSGSEKRNNLDRGEYFVRRVVRLIPQRVPHSLSVPQVLQPRFFNRTVAELVTCFPPGLSRTIECQWVAVDRGEHQVIEPFELREWIARWLAEHGARPVRPRNRP